MTFSVDHFDDNDNQFQKSLRSLKVILNRPRKLFKALDQISKNKWDTKCLYLD